MTIDLKKSRNLSFVFSNNNTGNDSETNGESDQLNSISVEVFVACALILPPVQ